MRRAFDGGTLALDGIDVDLVEGSFTAILGPSGCGKSTLLRLVAGLDAADSGVVQVDGVDPAVHLARARQDVRAPVGFVFQDAQLLPWRTALDNVALPLELRGTGRALAREQARIALGEVELDEAIGRYPQELSGGMRMRVSIARALVTQPRLLLLDEPFAALDEQTRQRLDERLRAVWDCHRMTILFVTHSLAEAVFLADRAIVLSPGPARIVMDRAIDLPHRRSSSLRGERAFSDLEVTLYAALEGTSLKKREILSA